MISAYFAHPVKGFRDYGWSAEKKKVNGVSVFPVIIFLLFSFGFVPNQKNKTEDFCSLDK